MTTFNSLAEASEYAVNLSKQTTEFAPVLIFSYYNRPGYFVTLDENEAASYDGFVAEYVDGELTAEG